jgi:signal transduction histidine kinase/ActR/RegA family two-component response regulator/CHASE3 domain sensor protein
VRRPFDLSISQRLAIGFGVLLLILGGYAVAVARWHAMSAEAERRFVEDIAPRQEQAIDLERAVLNVAIALRAYVVTPTSDLLASYRRAMEDARSRVFMLTQSSSNAAVDESVRSAVERYIDHADEMIGRVEASSFDLESELALRSSRHAALRKIRALSAAESHKRQTALSEMRRARESVADGILVASLAAVLGFMWLALLIARAVRTPAVRLMRTATALERGDWKPALALAPPPEARGFASLPVRDEMVHIARAFGTAARALERREHRLRAEGGVAAATASSLDGGVLCDRTLQTAVEFAEADVGVVYVLDEASDALVPLSRHAIDVDVDPQRVGEGIVGEAARLGRPVISREIPADTTFRVKLGFGEAVPKTVAALPIVFAGRAHGVLLIASLRDLPEDAVSFLERAAAQLGIGLENVRAYERAQRLLAEVREKSEHIQAQNEELQAQNEEIQTQSEQLQLQQEEIQAQNEELLVQSEELRSRSTMLEEADQRKNDFLGVLAHELRNPMASIVNGLFVLNHAKNDSQSAHARAVIERQTRHLTRLIDDLLDVTRIARGKVRIEREPVDVVSVVRTCAEDHRAGLEQAGLTFDLDMPKEPLIVTGDPTRLCQVVGNLLHNAEKFTQEGGSVRLSLRELESSREVEVRVSDSGIGIDQALLARLFEPFSQGASGLARSSGGLGLGLTVVKALVEQHGGSVEAHSQGKGRGSEFVIRLPLSATKASRADATKAPSAESNPKGRPLQVLIIDDNRDAAEMLSDAISLAGHRTEKAHSGAEGLERALMNRPDVVLCDIGLPIVDGYEVARRFRDDARLRSIFMVAVTGYTAAADQKAALEAGFDRHLGKPVDIEELRRMLREIGAAPGS